MIMVMISLMMIMRIYSQTYPRAVNNDNDHVDDIFDDDNEDILTNIPTSSKQR